VREHKDRVERDQDGVLIVKCRLEVLALRAVLAGETVVVMRLAVCLMMAMDESIVVPGFSNLVEVHWRHQRKAGNTESHDGTDNPDWKHWRHPTWWGDSPQLKNA
jgi:hypothetical protein